MTLAKGDHILKLDREGQPLTTERESYIEYEVAQVSMTWAGVPGEGIEQRAASAMKNVDDLVSNEVYCVALLRKVK